MHKRRKSTCHKDWSVNSHPILTNLRVNLVSFYKKYIGKGTILLLCFFVANSLAINIFLFKIYKNKKSAQHIIWKGNVGLYCTKFFLSSPTHTHSDSWAYLYKACHYLHKHHKDIYSEFYFNRGMKFQYSPMSTLPFYWIALKISSRKFTLLANFLSWISILVTVFILADIFSLILQNYVPEKAHLFGSYPAKLIVMFLFTSTFYPLMWSYRLGQVQTWIYFFFVLAMWIWMHGKKEISGIFIGVISLVKPQYSLFLIWGLLKKQRRFTISWSFPVILFTVISVNIYGWPHHVGYIKFLYYVSKHGESYYPNQSINGLLYRLFFIGSNIYPNISHYPPYNFWVHTGNYIAFFLFIIPALFIRRNCQYDDLGVIDFSIAALSFTIASPIAWIHHYSIMLPMFVIALPLVLKMNTKPFYMALLITSFFLSSNFIFLTNYLHSTKLNILQSLNFFGAILFLLLLYKLKFMGTVKSSPRHNNTAY